MKHAAFRKHRTSCANVCKKAMKCVLLLQNFSNVVLLVKLSRILLNLLSFITTDGMKDQHSFEFKIIHFPSLICVT